MIKYHSRYSDTDDLDDLGRWARIATVNNIQIAWITRHKIRETINFSVSCNFPTMANDTANEHKLCDSFTDAKDFVQERWEWFKENTK